MSKPNILLILTDQQSADAMSGAGNIHIKTPAMDQLAKEGVRFETAYCTYPHCVPSRSAIMYGRLPGKALHPGTAENMSGHSEKPIGVRDEFRDQDISKLLSRQGYDCVYAGKWHVEKWGPTESLREGNDTAFRSLCDIHDPKLPSKCADYFNNRPDDKPFFMVASFDNPHNICEWGSGKPLPWGNLPEPPALSELPPLPPNFAPSHDEPGQIRALRHNQNVEHDWTPEEWRRFRWAYNRLVEKADAGIGQLLDALDTAGLRDDTVILFTSDHGDQQGAHDLKNKSVFYDEAMRVPLILCDSNARETGRTDSETLVSNGPDLYATIADYAGAELPDAMTGISLRPVAEGRTLEKPHNYIVAEHEKWHGPRRRMIRTKRYKYCIYEDGGQTEQLFDMQTDPGEMVNLVQSAAYGDALKEHRKLCMQYLVETNTPWHGGHYTHPDIKRVPPGEDYSNL